MTRVSRGRSLSPAPRVLALDLEGTLISTAVSQFPRPGLFHFLERCRVLFERIVMFTSVPEERVRQIAQTLVEEGTAPAWFQHLQYVHWEGAIKDLAFISDCNVREALLVDDLAVYVHPAQLNQWVRIEPFEPPYADSDTGLAKVLDELAQRVRMDLPISDRRLGRLDEQARAPEELDQPISDRVLHQFEGPAPGATRSQEDQATFVARGLRSLERARRTGNHVEADEALRNLERKVAEARARKSPKDS